MDEARGLRGVCLLSKAIVGRHQAGGVLRFFSYAVPLTPVAQSKGRLARKEWRSKRCSGFFQTHLNKESGKVVRRSAGEKLLSQTDAKHSPSKASAPLTGGEGAGGVRRRPSRGSELVQR